MENSEWRMGNGEKENEELKMENCGNVELEMRNGKWGMNMGNGKWEMNCEEWRMAKGEWGVASGEWWNGKLPIGNEFLFCSVLCVFIWIQYLPARLDRFKTVIAVLQGWYTIIMVSSEYNVSEFTGKPLLANISAGLEFQSFWESGSQKMEPNVCKSWWKMVYQWLSLRVVAFYARVSVVCKYHRFLPHACIP